MIHLRTLGSIGLADSAGRELSAVLRQPKRFGLLAYLALARPRGFHRRDTLLAMFWPELDAERGRAALRQSLYTLRRQLPPQTLAKRGDGEVGLSIDHLWCDVREMERAMAAGKPERALEEYRGALLAGFHVPDASPELDYWMTAERDRLRDLALAAASDAVWAAESRGDLEAAARWATRAVEIAPLDEEAVRRELLLLHQVGDRAGALRSYEQWSGRLRDELDLEPSPATLQLVDRLRQSPLPPPPPPERPAVRAGSPPAEPLPSPDPPGSARSGARMAMRAAAALAVALLVLLIAVADWPLRLGWLDGAASPAGERLIVLPFTYRGGAEAEYLSEGMVHLFSVAMDGQDLRTVDPNALVRRAAEHMSEDFGPSAAAELAERMQAQLFLLGSVVESQGQLQLTATLYERGSEEPVLRASTSGTTAHVLDLVDQLAAELLTSRAGPSASRVTRLAAVTTSSLPALKAYLVGERRLREGRFDDAIEAFEVAVLADTLFALAHYRMSVAASWAFRADLATRAAERAVRHAERLPEHERRLLDAHDAYRRAAAQDALEALRQLASLYPDDPEVWYRLGEVLLHFGPLHGWPIIDAREPFLRAAELEPLHTGASYHLAQIEAALGNPEAALGFVRQALDAAPEGSRTPQLRTLQSILGAGPPWSARMEALATADDFAVVSSAYNVAVYLGRPALAHSIARLLVDPTRPRATRGLGYLLLADLDLALGRWQAAQGHLEALAKLDPARGEEELALLATAPAAALGEVERRELLRELGRAQDASGRPAAAVVLGPPDRLRTLARPYARGLLAIEAGDTAAIAEAIASVRAVSGEPLAVRELARDLELMAAAAGGAPPVSPPLPPVAAGPAEVSLISATFSRAARRYHEGLRLEEQGQLLEALRWYESLGHFSVHDLPWAVPALLDRARVHTKLGQRAEAERLYRRFADLWRDADDPGPRQAALEHVARLRGAGASP